jgi:hypothetical protein
VVDVRLSEKETDQSKEEIRTSGSGSDQCHDCRIALSPIDSQKLYLYSDKKLLVSNNGGGSWEDSIENGVRAVSVSGQDPNTAYAVLVGNSGSLNSVLTTNDGGKTWRAGSPSLQDVAISLGLSEPFQSVVIDPKNSSNAYAIATSAVFRTSDLGRTWGLVTRNSFIYGEVYNTISADQRAWVSRGTRRSFNAEIYDLAIDADISEALLLATENGVWRSTDSGNHWTVYSNNIPIERSAGDKNFTVEWTMPIYKLVSTKQFTLAFGKDVIYRRAK